MMKCLKILIVAGFLVPFPVTFLARTDGGISVDAAVALADKGRGRGRGGDDRDDDDRDDDDRSGRRGGDDDDRRDDRDDDRRDDDDRRFETERDSRAPGRTSDRPGNLHLRYANGWDERIFNGRYRLVDPQGRTVADRVATFADLKRMQSAAGL